VLRGTGRLAGDSLRPLQRADLCQLFVIVNHFYSDFGKKSPIPRNTHARHEKCIQNFGQKT
jgi:hypothetical protein